MLRSAVLLFSPVVVLKLWCSVTITEFHPNTHYWPNITPNNISSSCSWQELEIHYFPTTYRCRYTWVTTLYLPLFTLMHCSFRASVLTAPPDHFTIPLLSPPTFRVSIKFTYFHTFWLYLALTFSNCFSRYFSLVEPFFWFTCCSVCLNLLPALLLSVCALWYDLSACK